jgi:hypothetical protein
MAVWAGTADTARTPSPSLSEILARPGPDVALIQGTGDYAPGMIRVSFLVVRSDGQTVDKPKAQVWVGTSLGARPFEQATATLEPVGLTGTRAAAAGDVTHLYVTHLRIPKAGKYFLVAEPDGARIQGVTNLIVNARTHSPALGAKAYPSSNPTIASTHGNFSKLTTRTPQD